VIVNSMQVLIHRSGLLCGRNHLQDWTSRKVKLGLSCNISHCLLVIMSFIERAGIVLLSETIFLRAHVLLAILLCVR
jgi:hypothetical protein